MTTKLDEPSCSKYPIETKHDNQLAQDILVYFKPLDELLKCHICFDYFNTCMITKCCHTFCSLCIRKYMTYKAQCPECFQEATEPELRINRQIDGIVQIYSKIKAFLQPYAKNNLNSLEASTNAPEVSLESIEVPCEEESSNVDDHNVDENEDDRALNESQVDNNKVLCPVCSVFVSSEKINLHLDRCLLEQEEPSYSKKPEKRKPLPKVVYHLLSDKDIKKRLKEHGLSTLGNRQALIKRHKGFLLLYNSECDKVNPRPVADILKQVEKEETENLITEPSKLFQSSKKSSPQLIQEENEKYIQEHEKQFKDLVKDIYNRQQSRKTTKGANRPVNETCGSSVININITDYIEEAPVDPQSPDLFEQPSSGDLFVQSEDQSASIESILDPCAEKDSDAGPSSNSSEDIDLDQSNSRMQKKLKRKMSSSNANFSNKML